MVQKNTRISRVPSVQTCHSTDRANTPWFYGNPQRTAARRRPAAPSTAHGPQPAALGLWPDIHENQFSVVCVCVCVRPVGPVASAAYSNAVVFVHVHVRNVSSRPSTGKFDLLHAAHMSRLTTRRRKSEPEREGASRCTRGGNRIRVSKLVTHRGPPCSCYTLSASMSCSAAAHTPLHTSVPCFCVCVCWPPYCTPTESPYVVNGSHQL